MTSIGGYKSCPPIGNALAASLVTPGHWMLDMGMKCLWIPHSFISDIFLVVRHFEHDDSRPLTRHTILHLLNGFSTFSGPLRVHRIGNNYISSLFGLERSCHFDTRFVDKYHPHISDMPQANFTLRDLAVEVIFISNRYIPRLPRPFVGLGGERSPISIKAYGAYSKIPIGSCQEMASFRTSHRHLGAYFFLSLEHARCQSSTVTSVSLSIPL